MITKKINHVLVRVRQQVSDDEFLDAIETLPVEGELVRQDEGLIILGELKSALDRQWDTDGYQTHHSEHGYKQQTMR